MKWTIAFLVMLGILASLCAVLLVNAFRADQTLRQRTDEVTVVLAKRDLSAMTVVTSAMIEPGTVKKEEAPADSYGNSTLVVGKILAMPVVKDQILTKSCFISDGTGAQLAAALPPGMRAVSLMLSSQSITGGLLYPGCVVDVLVAFKLSGNRDSEVKGEALSTTLLHSIQVLAVAGDTVISTKSELADKVEKSSAAGRRNVTVTLLVDPKQAEALQLASENGSIALAMRNPLDKTPVSPEATVLSRGKLSQLGSLLGANVQSALRDVGDRDGVEVVPAIAERTTTSVRREPSHWGVTVIRGSRVEEAEVKLAE